MKEPAEPGALAIDALDEWKDWREYANHVHQYERDKRGDDDQHFVAILGKTLFLADKLEESLWAMLEEARDK